MIHRRSIIGARRSQVTRGEPRWRSQATLPPWSLQRGSITVDPGLQAMIMAQLEATAPAVAQAYHQHLEPMARHAFEKWPVRTGRSKSLLALEYTQGSPTTFTGSIVDRAEYAAMIKVKGVQIAKALIWDPVDQVAEDMVRDLGLWLSEV